MIKLLILGYLLLSLMAGCAAAEGLFTLKRLGAGQKEIGNYLERQERLFDKLMRDLKNKRIKPGISKQKIISTYGVPVLSKIISQAPLKTMLLYRYPVRYFDSDKVYLYFDQSEKLSNWECVYHK